MSELPDTIQSYAQIEEELRVFENDERRRLGLDERPLRSWSDSNPRDFSVQQRKHTTILVGGLTIAHDTLIQSALQGLGYQVDVLECPDFEALHVGKEFGNRGQCNPTYFTVGNLVKRLTAMRDIQGIPVERIEQDYLFVTAGSCGPCRFGTYVTEYRKALRDAGFENFRVLLFQQTEGLKQATGRDAGLAMTPTLLLQFLKAIVAGDVINMIGYRIRPYEVEAGATDAALEQSKKILAEAFRRRSSVLVALRRCRQRLRAVKVNRLQPKAKVMIIGEFWAMTTEGDGNHRLQRFLEEEGAEVDVQPITAWVLYLIWEVQHDTRRRLKLKSTDPSRDGRAAPNGHSLLVKLWAAERAVRVMFRAFATAVGLRDYQLPNMDRIADVSREFYDVELRGGEGHMEVGKLVEAVQKKKAHMVLSVKPFGCMPSASVSDGIQAAVLTRHPDAIFCAVETTGDGAVNFQSRVQMFLFKARQKARSEFETALQQRGCTLETARARNQRRHLRASHYPRHVVAGTAANQVLELRDTSV
jgi:predicted nucleotide-binding protein (sugar kinase/HSP70/actin superfamily)